MVPVMKRRRTQQIFASSKIDKSWVKKAKAKWKRINKNLKKAVKSRDVKEISKHAQEARKYIDLLRQDLLINKGFWVQPPVGSWGKAEEYQKRVVENLGQAEDGISMIQVGLEMLSTDLAPEKRDRREEIAYRSIEMGLDDADSFLSRRVFSDLNRQLNKNEEIDLGSFVPDSFQLGRAKVVFEDYGSEKPSWVIREKGSIRAPEFRDDYITAFDKAQKMLSKKGFGHLWYGNILIHLPSEGVMPGSGEWGNAKYNVNTDTVHYYAHARLQRDETAYSLIHELGHRHWYKFMDAKDRRDFTRYFGEVDPVSGYGGSNPEEDFAEVFTYYILNKKMNRDQVERFKQFAKKGSSSELNSIQRVAAMHLLGGSEVNERVIQNALNKLDLSWTYNVQKSQYEIEGGAAYGGLTLYWNPTWGSWAYKWARKGGPIESAFDLWKIITQGHYGSSNGYSARVGHQE